MDMLGDRLCWVYDPPVQSYSELSITQTALILCSSSLPLIIPYTHVVHTCCVPHSILVAVVVLHLSQTST